jgi:predicted nucleic acid-binding protein
VIAADSSSLVNFLQGAETPDRLMVREALLNQELWLPPPVKTELLSAPSQSALLDQLFAEAPLLEIKDGYWQRAGDHRRLLLSKGLKAKLADALIAQCCIDADVALITRDNDYRHFAQWCGLKLAP